MNVRLLIAAASVVAVAAWLLKKHLWRAILYFFPTSVTVEEDAPAHAKLRLPDALIAPAAELERLGLVFIGTHLEQPKLRPAILSFDYASGEAGAFVSLFVNDAGEARAELFTPMASGGFVRTANYRRSALELPGYFSGYLENVPLGRVLHAHQRRVTALGAPAPAWDVNARVAATRAWYQSLGAGRELRQQHANGLMWTFGAFVIGGVGLVTLLNAAQG